MLRALMLLSIFLMMNVAHAAEGEPLRVVSEVVAGVEQISVFKRTFNIEIFSSDGVNYSGSGVESLEVRLGGALGRCTHNMPTSSAIKVVGQKNGSDIHLVIEADLPSENLRLTCRHANGASTLPMAQWPKRREHSISLLGDGVHAVNVPGLSVRVRLQRGCGGGGVPVLNVASNLAISANRPPNFQVVHDLSGDQIKRRKADQEFLEESFESRGLTLLRLPVFLVTVAMKPAPNGKGLCVWLHEVEFKYPVIQILIDKKYPAKSGADGCNYRVALEHELLHYEDWRTASIKMQASLVTAMQGLGVPLSSSPGWYPGEVEGELALKSLATSALKEIVGGRLRAELQQRRGQRDTSENYEQVMQKCKGW